MVAVTVRWWWRWFCLQIVRGEGRTANREPTKSIIRGYPLVEERYTQTGANTSTADGALVLENAPFQKHSSRKSWIWGTFLCWRRGGLLPEIMCCLLYLRLFSSLDLRLTHTQETIDELSTLTAVYKCQYGGRPASSKSEAERASNTRH
jgi:hypothetical protein